MADKKIENSVSTIDIPASQVNITILSLQDLKDRLNQKDLDTSKDTFFQDEKVKNIKLSTQELSSLQAQMIWTDTEKLDKIKVIIIQKVKTEQKTNKETNKLKTELEKYPNNAEWMEKAFKAIKEAWISEIESEKQLAISIILNKFIYHSGFHITNDWNIFKKDLKVINNEGKENKEYSELLKKYLSEDEFRLDLAFRTSIWAEWKNMQERVNNILCKYNSNKDPEEKINIDEPNLWTLESQITNSCLDELEKALLLDYVRNKSKYILIDKKVNERIIESEQRLEEKKDEYEQKTWMKLDRQTLAEIVKNPMKASWKLLWSMNPISALALITSIIRWIFWDSAKPMSGFRKILIWIAGYWVVESFGWIKLLADSIEWKHDADFEKWYEATKEWLAWAWEKIKKIPEKIKWTATELTDRITYFWYFRDYQYTDIKWEKRDIIDSNFHELYSKTNTWFGTSLSRSDGKKPDKKDITRLNSKLGELHTKWIARYGNETAFQKATGNMSVAQIENDLTDNKPGVQPVTPIVPALAPTWFVAAWNTLAVTSNTSNNWPQSPAPAVWPVQTPNISQKEIDSNKKELKERISSLRISLISLVDKSYTWSRSNDINNIKNSLQKRLNELDSQINNKNIQESQTNLNLFENILTNKIQLLSNIDNYWLAYQSEYLKEINDYINWYKINEYSKKGFNKEWSLNIFTSVLTDFDLKWADMTDSDLKNNIVYIKLEEKIKNQFDSIPTWISATTSNIYKEYLYNEMKLSLFSSYKNSWTILRKLDEKHIDSLTFKSFDEWKAEFNV